MSDLTQSMMSAGNELSELFNSKGGGKLSVKYATVQSVSKNRISVQLNGATISNIRSTSACAGATKGDRVVLLVSGSSLLAIGTLSGPYPVGAVYISYVSTSPASLFGGSWTQITGRFLRAANDVSTGGADSVSHYHIGRVGADNNYIYAANGDVTSGISTVQQVPRSRAALYDKSGSSNAAVRFNYVQNTTLDNKPAYQDLYVWRRTA